MKSPELMISPGEAVILTNAGVKVAALYNWAPSETAVAWSGLIIAMTGIYAPRLKAIASRRRKMLAEAQPQADNVVDLGIRTGQPADASPLSPTE